MNQLYMKITGFDEASNSLLVCFASDETKSQDPTQYPILAYQPSNMWPDVTDTAQIPKLVAAAGVWETISQAKKEKFAEDPAIKEAYKALVGQTIVYNVADLLPPTTASIA